MSDISQVKLPDNSVYNIKDDNALPLTGGQVTGPVSFGDSVSIDDLTAGNVTVSGAFNPIQGITTDKFVPLQSKTYTGVYCSANNDPNAWLYFGHLIPTDVNAQVHIKFRVVGTMAGVSNLVGNQESIVEYFMYQSSMLWYSVWNGINNTSYRNWYNNLVYRATTAGITGGYGHLLGLRFQSSYSPASSTYARTITIEILELKNATFTFENSMILYANASGTGSTNYAGRNEYDGTTQGWTHTGDRNDVNYQNREYYAARKTNSALYRYMFCATKTDGSLVPMNSVNNSVATNKTLTTDSFDPFGDFFYWGSTSTYSANANVGDAYWYRQILFDLRYSFNCGGYDATGTLTARLPLYLVVTPQNDGSVVLYSSPLTQTLPSSDDGLLYIYLGRVYPDTYPYRAILSFKHPIFYYKNGAVKYYTAVDASDVGLGNVDNTSDATKKTNFTGSIAEGNTGFVTGGAAYTALHNKLDASNTYYSYDGDIGWYNGNLEIYCSDTGTGRENLFKMTYNSTTIHNVVTPTADGDAVPKSYVDGVSLPSVTASDNGKVLMVVNGAWAAASLPVYNGGVS